jgi:hypothetical protein
MGVRAGANVISENQEANVKVRSGVVVFGNQHSNSRYVNISYMKKVHTIIEKFGVNH